MYNLWWQRIVWERATPSLCYILYEEACLSCFTTSRLVRSVCKQIKENLVYLYVFFIKKSCHFANGENVDYKKKKRKSKNEKKEQFKTNIDNKCEKRMDKRARHASRLWVTGFWFYSFVFPLLAIVPRPRRPKLRQHLTVSMELLPLSWVILLLVETLCLKK